MSKTRPKDCDSATWRLYKAVENYAKCHEGCVLVVGGAGGPVSKPSAVEVEELVGASKKAASQRRLGSVEDWASAMDEVELALAPWRER